MGNLDERLAQVAEDMVRDGGLGGFSLRECPRRADVAHSAPAHHFGDVTGLLTEVAARGFARLTASMRAERGELQGAERLGAIGLGYLRFALAEPAIIELMFHSDRIDRTRESFKVPAQAAMAELVGAMASFRGTAATDDDVRYAWAGIHGVSLLLSAGAMNGVEASAASVEAIYRPFEERLLRGLGRNATGREAP